MFKKVKEYFDWIKWLWKNDALPFKAKVELALKTDQRKID